MSRRRGARAVLLLLLALPACRADAPSHSGDPALDATVRVSPTPAAVGEARVFVVATDAGAALEGASVRVRAFPAAEAASPSAEWTPAPAAPGGYGPVALPFPTAGSWWVEVDVTADGGRHARTRHPLAVVTGS